MSYVVYAEIPVKPQHLEDAKVAVVNICSDTRAEAGCEQFNVHSAPDSESKLLIYERWRDRSAFEFHHAQSYTKAVYALYETWLAGPPVLTELRDVG